jgi:hypothetical protein
LERLEGLRCRQDLAHDRFGALKYGAWWRAPVVLGLPSIRLETLRCQESGRTFVRHWSFPLDGDNGFIAELHVFDERPFAGVTLLAIHLADRVEEILETGHRDHGSLI